MLRRKQLRSLRIYTLKYSQHEDRKYVAGLTDSTMQLYTVYLKQKQLLKNHLASEPVYRRILIQIKNWTGCHISMLNIDPGLLFQRWKLRPKSLNIPVVIINSSYIFFTNLWFLFGPSQNLKKRFNILKEYIGDCHFSHFEAD